MSKRCTVAWLAACDLSLVCACISSGMHPPFPPALTVYFTHGTGSMSRHTMRAFMGQESILRVPDRRVPATARLGCPTNTPVFRNPPNRLSSAHTSKPLPMSLRA